MLRVLMAGGVRNRLVAPESDPEPDNVRPYDYTTALRRPQHLLPEPNPSYLRLIAQRPFVLNIETVSICNARCCFCPYVAMQRARGYMRDSLYLKILTEYAEMGGGALLLTPVLGDFFLDRSALQRIHVARRFPAIGAISLTTNAIALDRYSDADLAAFIEKTDYLQISLGGADEERYARMFGVDAFSRVRSNVLRFARLRRNVRPDYPLRLIFRVDCDEDTLRAEAGFRDFEDLGTEIVVDSTFGNWGGLIPATALPPGATARASVSARDKAHPCFMLYLSLAVATSGVATACSCMDSELLLTVGDCNREHLADIWKGTRRAVLARSFGTDGLPSICGSCNFYQDGEDFLRTEEVARFREGRFPFGY
jgi:MoaA/NifB/PqqE/SkfB family radical SAM enzyme